MKKFKDNKTKPSIPPTAEQLTVFLNCLLEDIRVFIEFNSLDVFSGESQWLRDYCCGEPTPYVSRKGQAPALGVISFDSVLALFAQALTYNKLAIFELLWKSHADLRNFFRGADVQRHLQLSDSALADNFLYFLRHSSFSAMIISNVLTDNTRLLNIILNNNILREIILRHIILHPTLENIPALWNLALQFSNVVCVKVSNSMLPNIRNDFMRENIIVDEFVSVVGEMEAVGENPTSTSTSTSSTSTSTSSEYGKQGDPKKPKTEKNDLGKEKSDLDKVTELGGLCPQSKLMQNFSGMFPNEISFGSTSSDSSFDPFPQLLDNLSSLFSARDPTEEVLIEGDVKEVLEAFGFF